MKHILIHVTNFGIGLTFYFFTLNKVILLRIFKFLHLIYKNTNAKRTYTILKSLGFHPNNFNLFLIIFMLPYVKYNYQMTRFVAYKGHHARPLT